MKCVLKAAAVLVIILGSGFFNIPSVHSSATNSPVSDTTGLVQYPADATSAASRDARRLADMQQLVLALGLYKDDYGSYPVFQLFTDTAIALSDLTKSGVMQVIPSDPLNTRGRVYEYRSNGYEYTLRAHLEDQFNAACTNYEYQQCIYQFQSDSLPSSRRPAAGSSIVTGVVYFDISGKGEIDPFLTDVKYVTSATSSCHDDYRSMVATPLLVVASYRDKVHHYPVTLCSENSDQAVVQGIYFQTENIPANEPITFNLVLPAGWGPEWKAPRTVTGHEIAGNIDFLVGRTDNLKPSLHLNQPSDQDTLSLNEPQVVKWTLLGVSRPRAVSVTLKGVGTAYSQALCISCDTGDFGALPWVPSQSIPQGKYKIQVTASGPSGISLSAENKYPFTLVNDASTTLMPDLTITKVSFKPDHPKPNDPIQASVWVKNIGPSFDEFYSGTNVTATIAGGDGGYVFAKGWFSSGIAHDQEIEVDGPLDNQFSQPGVYTLVFHTELGVRIGSPLHDRDLNNNFFTTTLTVESPNPTCPSQDAALLQRFDTNHNNVIDNAEATSATNAWVTSSLGAPTDQQMRAITAAWTSGCQIIGSGIARIGSNPLSGKQWPDDYIRDLGGKIAVIGGWSGSGNAVRDVEFYDLKSGQVSTGPSLNVARTRAATTAFQNRLFAFGGSTAFTNGSILASVEVLNPREEKWQFASPLKFAVANASAVAIGKRIYLFGGTDTRGRDTNLLQVYLPEKNQWLAGSPMPHKRQVLCVQQYADIYCFGKDSDLAYADVYNTATSTWSQRVIENRTWLRSLSSIGFGKIYINALANDTFIYSYDTVDDTWWYQKPAPFGASLASMVALGNFVGFATDDRQLYIGKPFASQDVPYHVASLAIPRGNASAAYLPPRPLLEHGAVISGVVLQGSGKSAKPYTGGVIINLERHDYAVPQLIAPIAGDISTPSTTSGIVRIADSGTYGGAFKFTGLPMGDYILNVLPLDDSYDVTATDNFGRVLVTKREFKKFRLSDFDKLNITIRLSNH